MRAAPTNQLKSSQRKAALARQIVNLALHEKWEEGHHLGETQLAESLGVSRTPIRAALEYLENCRIVKARQNHGYFLTKGGFELSSVDLEVPKTTEDELYINLVGNRAKGLTDESLTQTEIMRRYKASRVTVAKVLNRLADEGLVVRNAGQGWSFMPTLDSLQSRHVSYEFRLALEPAAILSASFEIDPEVLEQQRAVHQDLLNAAKKNSANRNWIYEIDANFHEAIAAFSGNQFFVSAVAQQNRLRRVLELWDGGNLLRVKKWCYEHLQVIEALEANNTSAAAEKMALHLTTAARASNNR